MMLTMMTTTMMTMKMTTKMMTIIMIFSEKFGLRLKNKILETMCGGQNLQNN